MGIIETGEQFNNDDLSRVLKHISVAILITTQLLYIVLTLAAIYIFPAILLGWGLVSDYKYSPSPLAHAIYYRAQILLCSHLSFPLIAFVASLVAWKYHLHKAFKKAIVIGLIPLPVVLLYFILLQC